MSQRRDGESSVEVFRSWRSLPEEVLQFIDATSENPFMRTAWLGCWYATYRRRAWRTHVVILKHGGAIRAVAPLTTLQVGPVRLFRFAGHGLGNYLDIVARRGDHPYAVHALLDYIADMHSAVLEWHDLNSESASFGLVPGRCVRLYPNPRATLRPEWSAHFRAAIRNSKARQRLTRKRRRLELRGLLSFAPVVTIADSALVAEMHDLHRRRFSGTRNSLLEPRFWRFFGSLVDTTLGQDLIISVLRLDGRLISFLAGLNSHGTFISYLLAFEPSLARDSPGHVHLMLFQEHLSAAGWQALDFSKGEARYKRDWSNGETSNWDHVVGFGVLGRVAAGILGNRTRLRAWARTRGITRVVSRMLTRRKRAITAN